MSVEENSNLEDALKLEESDRVEDAKLEDVKIEEMKKLIVEGKVSINELIKSIVGSIVPKQRKPYVRTAVSNKPKITKEEKKAYQRAYYQQTKEKRAQMYKDNRDLLNENQKKYYRLKKIVELQEKMERKIASEN